jgi:transposase
MRGEDEQQEVVFSYRGMEQRIPTDHPLRGIRRMTDRALADLSLHFEALYARRGRPSIAPEKLLRALLLQLLYSLRSERQLMQHLDYNLLFRWFVGLNMDERVWDVTVFTKNRERLMQGEVSQRLLEAILQQAAEKELLSEEHFTVDGTLLQAWASRRSFRPKDPPPASGTGARGKKLLRDTHESTTDPQARLYRKSSAGEIKPGYLGHVLTENRKGLVVAACATQCSKTAEQEAGLQMLDRWRRRAATITLGADRGFQAEDFIAGLRERQIVPHVSEYEPNPKWLNWLTEAERNDPGFPVSQKKRKLVEMVFGWCKQSSVLRQVKVRGLSRVDWLFRLAAAAHNLCRMRKLILAQ